MARLRQEAHLKRPKVKTAYPADRYRAWGERIIEFSHEHGGGLVSFQAKEDGTLMVTVYRHDKTVIVREGERDET